jgi:hypothetical protein
MTKWKIWRNPISGRYEVSHGRCFVTSFETDGEAHKYVQRAIEDDKSWLTQCHR